MRLLRAGRREFPGDAEVLADADHRAQVTEYFGDLARPFGAAPAPELAGQSYGEMAAGLVAEVVPAEEPVDLLVLAFSVHDVWPGRATATYLSHLCPGTPVSFAICDQGSAAPFTGLRVIRDYGARRALLIAVEQSALPYESTAALPLENRGVAMVFGGGAGTDLRQYPDVAPEAVPELASRAVAELSAGHPGARVVLSESLADAWPGRPDHVRASPGQPTTGVWWHLVDEPAGSADVVLVGDYDRQLRYLCLAAVAVR